MKRGPQTMQAVRGRAYIFAPLAFLGVGVALSAVAAFRDGQGLAGVIGAAGALFLVYWLGRRSQVEATAVAVAEAVATAVADARAEATAQALSQVAVIVGDDARHLTDEGARVVLERHHVQDFLVDAARDASNQRHQVQSGVIDPP